MSDPIRILAIDGGGIGGVIPAVIIRRLVEKYPGLLINTDVFAGTSTGGLVALALARRALSSHDDEVRAAAEVVELYKTHAGTIFNRRLRRFFLLQLLYAKYRPDGLLNTVRAFFGTDPDATLGKLHKPVVIPVTALERPYQGKARRLQVPAGVCFSTANRCPKIAGGKQMYRSASRRCVDIAMATCAAPVYFPAHEIRYSKQRHVVEWRLWDGGIVANNPALAAVGEVARLTAPGPYDVRVLTIGTGYNRTRIPAGDSGLYPISKWIATAFIDTGVGTATYVLGQLLRDHILRLNVPLTRPYLMDDPSAVPGLEAETSAWCDAYVKKGERVIQTGQPAKAAGAWLETHWGVSR